MTHNHHIVPRHAGGSNDPSNLVCLTILEHAEAHRVLYEQYGRLGDKCAWLMLLGRTEEGELARRELQYESMHSPKVRAKMSMAHMGIKLSPEHRAKMSVGKIGNKNAVGHICSPEHRAKISAFGMGRKPSPETCAKISAAKMGRKHRQRGA